MVILGIDPGLARIGYGVVEYARGVFRPIAYGCLTTQAHTPLPSRLCVIYEELSALIERYRPDEMAVEELFFGNNATTGIPVAQARGVILLCGAQKGLPISEYKPASIKQAVVGYGKAEKHQVIMMVNRLLRLIEAPKLDDTADALAVAICHAYTSASPLRALYEGR